MAEERARQLSRVVAGVRDQTMAVSYLRHELLTMSADEAADVFVAAAAAATGPHAQSGDLLLWCCVALAEPSLADLRASIAALAESRGETDAAAMLVTPAEGGDGEPDAARIPDFGAGRTLTLGERKSLARRRDRNVLARVLRDPHPDVIEILLGNPALTEPDVVRLCALRPVPPSVLRAVFRAPRWVVRYGVRLALIKNPYAPLDVSLALVPSLRRQDAREVATSPDLAPGVQRSAAKAMLPRVFH